MKKIKTARRATESGYGWTDNEVLSRVEPEEKDWNGPSGNGKWLWLDG